MSAITLSERRSAHGHEIREVAGAFLADGSGGAALPARPGMLRVRAGEIIVYVHHQGMPVCLEAFQLVH
jgi:hypothetical protein